MTILEAFTVEQFLRRYPISRTSLYREWRNGGGPKRCRVGRRILITAEAAREWMQSLEEGALDDEN